ncbi:MAG: hypothetical protein IKS40_08935 [Treponema sp.]|nr:hypothetical protein [Treponema sp.]
MNNMDIKAQLLAAGAKEEDLAKVDFAKIESIVDKAGSIGGLCKELKEAFPEFNEADFRKTLEENSDVSEVPQELSDDDLEAVAGGSVGSWISEHKALVTMGVLIAISIPVGFAMRSEGKAAGNKAVSKAYDKGYGEGSNLVQEKVSTMTKSSLPKLN